MKKILIHENQRGLLFRGGKFVRVLGPGKYFLYGDREIELHALEHRLDSQLCRADMMADNSMMISHVVEPGKLAIHLLDGQYIECLESGYHLFWKAAGEHTFLSIDPSQPEPDEAFPTDLWKKLPNSLVQTVEVAEYAVGRLMINYRFVRLLEAGVYHFWKSDIPVQVICEDTRLQRIVVVGQEILTADKVSLRINFVCNYRITDYVRIAAEIDDYREQMHMIIQFALRELVGNTRLDDLLENRDSLAQQMTEQLKEKAKSMYVSIEEAGIRDIILPGEIRQIMNSVLMAEKQAQANVITRREEVASTRSLLNTAKLMEDNPMLYRLKQMEALEKICARLDSLHINGNIDILSQMLGAIDMKGA